MASEVQRVHGVTARDFQERIAKVRNPVVLCGLHLGDAPKKWNPQYLREKCGNLAVKVHVCPVAQMDFINKNFAYK